MREPSLSGYRSQKFQCGLFCVCVYSAYVMDTYIYISYYIDILHNISKFIIIQTSGGTYLSLSLSLSLTLALPPRIVIVFQDSSVGDTDENLYVHNI